MDTSKRLVLLSLAALVIAAVWAAGCGGTTTNQSSGPGVGETVGVTDTTIKIGTLLPLSNSAAAAWGVPLSKGMKAYFDYINDQGGIYGRKIELVVGDSQYTGAVAAEAVRTLVEQDDIFSLQGSLGSEAHSAVYKYLEGKGIPDMYILTGDTKWTDPVVHSRFGFLVDYITEGRILGQYIAKNFDGKKLGILEQNDEFGSQGDEGIRKGIADANASLNITVQYYDASQNDVTSQVQALKAAGVDVIAFYGMPVQAGNLVKVARQTLTWDVPVVITGTDAVEVLASLAGGENLEGAVSVVFGHQAFETNYPGIQKYKDIMAKYGDGAALDNLTLVGLAVSESTVHALEQAGQDLTRSSFLDAAESSCNFYSSTSMVPSNTSPTDHRPLEAEVYVKGTYDHSTDPPTFKWVPFGDVVSYETTTNCVAPTPPAGYDQQPQ